MHTYLIALGSNLGDRKYYIEEAIKAIGGQCGKVLAVAPLLETSPIGAADQLFINTALTLESQLEPDPLLAILLAIELELGRQRKEKWGNRTIDLDIILWRSDAISQVYQSPSLTIPHPECLKRDFVLHPAQAVAGDWIHPLEGLKLKELSIKKGDS